MRGQREVGFHRLVRRQLGALAVTVLVVGVVGTVDGATSSGVATVSAVRSIDFGSATVPLVGSGPQMDLVITNVGSSTLQLGSPTISGAAKDDFLLVTPSAPMNIGPGSDRTLTIEFLPSVVGTRTASLTMSSNDATRNPLVVTLNGVGTTPTGGGGGSGGSGGGSSGGGGATPKGSRFVSSAPQRIVDSREGLGLAGPLVAGAGVTITLPSVVPSGATAVVLNVTATRTAGPGFVALWPAGQAMPVTSNLNLEQAGQTIANLVTVPIGAGRAISVLASVATDLIADLAGWYEAAATSASGRLHPVTPTRVLDTRDGGGSPIGPATDQLLALADQFGLPAGGMSAVVLNVTVTDPDGAGYVTVWPADQPRPTTSNVNPERAGETIANQAIVSMPVSGTLRVFASGRSHVVIDVTGWFTDATQPTSATGLFWPTGPTRVLDTRSGARPAAGGTVVVPLAAAGVPADAIAIVANVTATDAAEPGYVTAWSGDGGVPVASNVNVDHAGQSIPNHVTTPVGHRSFSLFTNRGTHLLADVAGWYSA